MDNIELIRFIKIFEQDNAHKLRRGKLVELYKAIYGGHPKKIERRLRRVETSIDTVIDRYGPNWREHIAGEPMYLIRFGRTRASVIEWTGNKPQSLPDPQEIAMGFLKPETHTMEELKEIEWL